MSAAHGQVTLVCCSVAQAEVTALWQVHWPHLKLRYQNSMLHMRPAALAARLELLAGEELRQGRQVVLIYGDCCLQMRQLEARPGIVRTRANNCCALLLGDACYRKLSHEGAFFVFPEWTVRWREIFRTELGLNQENAASLMRDMHRKLVYLDTGVLPVPEAALQECAEYCGLPWVAHPTPLDVLRQSIDEALSRLVPPLLQ